MDPCGPGGPRIAGEAFGRTAVTRVARTDRTGFDTGAFTSARTVRRRQRGVCRVPRRGSGSSRSPPPAAAWTSEPACWTTTPCAPTVPAFSCRNWPRARAAGASCWPRRAQGARVTRSVAFNAHSFRVAVHPMTGEVRVLNSVQDTDAGVIINLDQVRGQVEGGVAQGLASTRWPCTGQRGGRRHRNPLPRPSADPRAHLRTRWWRTAAGSARPSGSAPSPIMHAQR
jgi:putative selenate reductase molybdopterin-binding subunit